MANPVLINDMRRSMIRRRPVLAVALMALAILVLTLGVAGGFPIGGMMYSQTGPLLLWRFPDLTLPAIAPAFASGAFAKEYEQRTWQDVMLTRLRAGEILGGKFFAAYFPTLSAIIVLFPPFAMMLILLNMNWAMDPGPWMLIVGAKFMISALFYVALVLVCSYHCKTARTALAVSYVLLAFYLMLNYALWEFILIPLFLAVPDYLSNSDSPYYSPYAPTHFWGISRNQFTLSLADTLHLLQSAILGTLLLAYLGVRLRRRS